MKRMLKTAAAIAGSVGLLAGACYANNSKDTYFKYYVSRVRCVTELRDKTDTSSCYMNYISGTPDYIYGSVYATDQVTNMTVGAFSYECYRGQSIYIPSNTYEYGYRSCCLSILGPSYTPEYAYGCWSPDSV